MAEGIYVGVLRMTLRVPGARSLKDSRQVLVSLRDRIRHRFEVTFHEVPRGGEASVREVVMTTAGSDARLIRSVLDRIRAFIDSAGQAWPAEVDVDVFRWHPPERTWNVGDLEPEGSWEEEDG